MLKVPTGAIKPLPLFFVCLFALNQLSLLDICDYCTETLLMLLALLLWLHKCIKILFSQIHLQYKKLKSIRSVQMCMKGDFVCLFCFAMLSIKICFYSFAKCLILFVK